MENEFEVKEKSSRVDLATLQKFPNPTWGSGFMNILEEITNYKRLGNALLKSPKGERVRQLQTVNSQGGNRDVLYDIFQTWLTEEEEATWDELVGHLYTAGYTAIAEAIETRLRPY